MVTACCVWLMRCDAISGHPAVDQVAVIGIPHELWGEQVHAVVVRKAGAEVPLFGPC